MRINENAIADLIDRVGGVHSYTINYKNRTVFLTTMAGERVVLSYDDLVAWIVERMKQNVVH